MLRTFKNTLYSFSLDSSQMLYEVNIIIPILQIGNHRLRRLHKLPSEKDRNNGPREQYNIELQHPHSQAQAHISQTKCPQHAYNAESKL